MLSLAGATWRALELLLRPFVRVLEGLGAVTTGALEALGEGVRLAVSAGLRAPRRPVQPRSYLRQLIAMGIESLPLSLTMSVFAGLVLAYQFGSGLERFGARLFIGQITVYAILREMGPVLTALVVGGRVGAGMAAELGGMAVSEQIDATRAVGADPLQRLVAPRLLATTIMIPLLTVVSDAVGFAASLAVGNVVYGISPRLFLRSALEFCTIADFASGLVKSLIFAALIATVACREGLRTSGGTEGVGRAATRAVVRLSLAVLFADVLLTRAFITWQ